MGSMFTRGYTQCWVKDLTTSSGNAYREGLWRFDDSKTLGWKSDVKDRGFQAFCSSSLSKAARRTNNAHMLRLNPFATKTVCGSIRLGCSKSELLMLQRFPSSHASCTEVTTSRSTPAMFVASVLKTCKAISWERPWSTSLASHDETLWNKNPMNKSDGFLSDTC